MAESWEVAPILGVSNVLGAVDYFCEQLGFTRPLQLYGPPEERVYAIVSRGGVSVHLQIRRGTGPTTTREGHEGEAFFRVPDADALRDEFLGRGVTFLRDIQDEPYGLRDFTIVTPEGLRLTFGAEREV